MQVARTNHAATDVREGRTFRSGPYLDNLFGAGDGMDAYLETQICERIKRARKQAGLTQEDAANLLSVSTRAYQNYERDRVPFRSLEKLARLFNVTQEWLLRGDAPVPQLPRRDLQEAMSDALATLEDSQESVHRKLDEVLQRLEQIEGSLSPPEAGRGNP